jgi:eukaryotic-like serine/threonine-protein kinase
VSTGTPNTPNDDPPAALPESLAGRYRIGRVLGRGGMASVHLARDEKHGRDVAIKVIRQDLSASLGHERFLREIEIAARLRHPNIVPLFDSGEVDGSLFFVMPYEEGQSLRERLGEAGALPIPDALNVLRDVARALCYAHEHGVVHRDIKPDNVMLSGGAAVVTDFGIAKAVSVALTDASDATLTQAGTVIGTPAYMAPEQATGDAAVDHRADIYSFGCLAYELFAGHPPFHDLPMHELIAAHVGTKPVPLSTVSASVPESVSELVARCLEKSPAARPQTAQEVLAELEASRTDPRGVVRPYRQTSRVFVGASAVVGAAVLLGVVGYFVSRFRAQSAAPRELTVAVLPLVVVGDTTQRDLAYGLSDEVATALVKVRGVRVMSRGTVAGAREQRDIDPEKTGRELGAQFLVMGSLKATSGRLTVLAKLVRARDGVMVWADQFDRRLDELEAVRNEITRSVGDSLRQLAGVPADARSGEKPTRVVDPEAYRLYVLGQRALALRAQSIHASVDLFTRATKLDTLYADAFSGLSLALALTPYFEPVSAMSVAGDVRSAAQRALRLDSTLAAPHVALGLVHTHAYSWDSAATEFETAVRLRAPDDIDPPVQYSRYLLARGRSADAVRQLLTARRTEPASALISSWLAYAYFLNGQMDSALVESGRAFQNDSTNMTTLFYGASIRLEARDSAGARNLVTRMSPVNPKTLYVLAATGDTAIALGRLRELERLRPSGWLTAMTRAYVMLGMRDTTRALAALEQATDANEFWPSYGSVFDPMFDPIRSSARFHALLRRVNLPVSDATIARHPRPR